MALGSQSSTRKNQRIGQEAVSKPHKGLCYGASYYATASLYVVLQNYIEFDLIAVLSFFPYLRYLFWPE